MYSILNKISEYILSIIKKTLIQRFFTFFKNRRMASVYP